MGYACRYEEGDEQYDEVGVQFCPYVRGRGIGWSFHPVDGEGRDGIEHEEQWCCPNPASEAEMDEHVGVGIGEDGQHEHGGEIGKGMPFRREKRHSRHNALDALQDEGGDDGS